MNSLDRKEKIAIIVGILIILLLTGVALIYGAEVEEQVVDALGGGTEESLPVISDSGEVKEEHYIVAVDVIDAGAGQARLVLNAEEPVALAGAELFLEISDDLVIDEIGCGAQFDCVYTGVSGGVLKVVALRPVLEARAELVGEILIATFSYPISSGGVLTINAEDVETSTVVETGSTENLVPWYLRSYTVGN